MYIYIYIYSERERERYIYIYNIYINIEYKERKKETTSFQDIPNFRQRPSSGDVYIYIYIVRVERSTIKKKTTRVTGFDFLVNSGLLQHFYDGQSGKWSQFSVRLCPYQHTNNVDLS